MKHTKKLIPALGMLLLSACMLVTSTFAWFSMNTEVTAKGMTVKAVGDQVYLQIIQGADATKFSSSEPQKEATGLKTTEGLIPAAVVANVTIPEAGLALDGVSKYTGGTYSWVTNTSNSATDWQAASKYYTADSEKYYLHEQFMIRLNKDAGKSESTAALKASTINLTSNAGEPLAKCVSVLVVCGEGTDAYTQLFKQKDGAFKEVEGATEGKWGKLTADKFANTTGLVVNVYVFFDGENENCTIANYALSKQNSYSVTVAFTCS